MKKTAIIFLFCAFGAHHLFAQNEWEIDASKPTNFYSQYNSRLETILNGTDDIFAYRGQLFFAPSQSHLIKAELPLLTNNQTDVAGIGDVKLQYSYLAYRDYSKFFGAVAPSLEVTAPTGSYLGRLGSGRWVVSPGVTVGLIAADWIQFFPSVSYQYFSEPTYDTLFEFQRESANGFTIKLVTPIVFSESLFIQITPTYVSSELNEKRDGRFVQEFFAGVQIRERLQLNGFFNGNFDDKNFQFGVGLNSFF